MRPRKYMVNYDLTHLTQAPDQRVYGPIQDDEALFLYSIIRGARMRTILEFGGLSGYSARNFIAALAYDDMTEKYVYTCELSSMEPVAPNHRIIQKHAAEISRADFCAAAAATAHLDMVFFDCHDFSQMTAYDRLLAEGVITQNTVLALHDTNLHYFPYQTTTLYYPEKRGFVHEYVEYSMVEMFRERGYNTFQIRTDESRHHDGFPFRHGITICQK